MTKQYTIGQLIDELSQFPLTQRLRFDFCGLIPATIQSWRGSYCEAALTYSDGGETTVGKLVEELTGSISGWAVHYGYKGGEYTYTRDTPIHVDNYGQSTETEISRLSEIGIYVVMHTEYREY